MKSLKVDPIKEGTVIDHIPANRALKVISIINPEKDDIVTVGINFSSKKFGRKDIVKIEGRELTPSVVNSIALVAPQANVIIIRNYKVVNKRLVQIPDEIKGSVKCGNPKCISNVEEMETHFITVSRAPVKLRCNYCERVFHIDELKVK
jgi:aspartate carbamoyltransferase regulatory subunit